MTRGILLLTISTLLLLPGCGGSANLDYVNPERLENGLVIVLPGIEGESPMNHSIRQGLIDAGVYRAVPIYRWGRPIPLAGPLINQMDVVGNRLAGQRIARMIVEYQDAHPGRPVHLVGHSGGGGVAVFAAEALPAGRKVDGLVLLSASISEGYDLSDALRHTRSGIVNFYTSRDVGLLVIGTTLAGNVDGVRGPAAGAAGFERSYSRLYQIDFSAAIGRSGAHSAATQSGFVMRCVAPWVLSGAWPAGRGATAAASDRGDIIDGG